MSEKHQSLVKVIIGFVLIIGAGIVGHLYTMTLVKSADESVIVQTKNRITDYGFKLKVNDCLVLQGEDLVVVDIDNKDTYVLATAHQYFSGPFPITEESLRKVLASEVDADPTLTKVECSKHEEKHTHEAVVSTEVPESMVKKEEVKKPKKTLKKSK